MIIDTTLLAQIMLPQHHQQLYLQAWHSAKEKYLISSKTCSFDEILDLAEKLNLKVIQKPQFQKECLSKTKMQVWGFGELKIFETVCIVYSLLKAIQLQLFAEHQYCFLKRIFLRKTENFLKYELASLLKSRVKNCAEWKKAQIQMLLKIVEEDQRFLKTLKDGWYKLEWNYYSFQLFVRSKGRYYRTLQQCRQKWVNYLNPHLNNGPWNIQQDIKLFELIKELGFKWAAISKHFRMERTEHMVKNRYNSIIKVWRNKDRKNILAQQISQKVLAVLYQKVKKGVQFDKREICSLLDSQSSTPLIKQQENQNNVNQKLPHKQTQKQSLESVQSKKIDRDSLESEDQQNESCYAVSENIVTMHYWNKQIQFASYSKCREQKEEKKTWDNDFQLTGENNKSKEEDAICNRLEIADIQDLQMIRLPVRSEEECTSNQLQNPLVGVLNCQLLQQYAWIEEFNQRDLMSWLD